MTPAHDIRQFLDNWGVRFQNPSILKTKGKQPRWIIRPVVPIIRPDGTPGVAQRDITLGVKATMSRKEAEREKQRVMAEINGGQGLIQAQLCLSHLIEPFKNAHLPQLAPSTQKKYSTHLKNHIEKLSSARLVDLTPVVLQEWLMALKVAPATRADVRNIISAIFERARVWKLWTGGNPVEDVRLGRMLPAREKYLLTEGQLRDLCAALDCCGAVADGVTGPDVRLIVDVILTTGWRLSEVLALKHDAIEGEQLVVRRSWYRGHLTEHPKTAAGFRRNWVGPLAATLAARPGEFVFQNDKGLPPDERSMQQYILRPAAESVGVYRPGFGFRLFRRENISWRQEAGATPAEVMRAAGHTKIDTTMIYTVVDEERERRVVETVRGRLQ